MKAEAQHEEGSHSLGGGTRITPFVGIRLMISSVILRYWASGLPASSTHMIGSKGLR